MVTALRNIKNILLVLITIFISFFGTTFYCFAEDQELNQQVESAEEERKDQFRDYLGLDLPEETDNPNYQVKFSEPDNSEVEIKVDDEDYSAKKSPYTLPSLSIGKHTITFKFEDEEGVEQTLVETIIILPRAPIFSKTGDTSFDSGEQISFSGTALPNSSVIFLISSDLIMEIVSADSEGNWSLLVTHELSEGSHEITGFVRKDGYASDFSDPISFGVGTSSGSELEVGEPDRGFNFNLEINWNELFSEQNKYYFIGAGGVLLLIILVVVGSSFRAGSVNKKDIEKLNNGCEDNSKKMSLREKLSSVTNKSEVVSKDKQSQTEKPVQNKEPEPKKTEEKDVIDAVKKANIEHEPKKNIFSFLNFGKNKEAIESKEVKKVVTKDDFLEDFKDGKLDNPQKPEVSKTKEKSNTGQTKITPVKKTATKKSNTIEVTLG